MGKNTRGRTRPATTTTGNGSIVLAIPSRGTCESHVARTLSDMVLWDARLGRQHLNADRPIIWTVGASQIVNARNVLVRQFLAQDHGDWLLMLDDDQLYPKDLLEYLIEAADPVERPILGVPVWRFIGGGEGGPVSVGHNVFDLHESNGFVVWPDPLPENAVMQVAAVGTGCLMIHRSALLAMQAWSEAQGLGTKWCWFRHSIWQPADMSEGEDLYFCRLAHLVGFPVFVSTFTTLGHVKSIILDGDVPPGLVSV